MERTNACSETTSNKWHLPLLGTVPPDPRPEDYARQAKRWLDACLTAHVDCCSPPVQELPTRVIDVGNELDDPRLFETAPGAQGIYCTLSYCWGQTRTFTTTLSTFEDRKKGFGIDELPATIRDAVVLARGLGIRYLWVDSLCIIQDSSSDWEYEAARMCSVYNQAAITFAAIDSPASETGLFIAGSDRRLVKLDEQWGPIYARMHSHSAPDDHRSLPRDEITSRVLNTRGWCLQELALSSRILWYVHGMIVPN